MAAIINTTKAILNESNKAALNKECDKLGLRVIVTKGKFDEKDSLLAWYDKDGNFVFMIDLNDNVIV